MTLAALLPRLLRLAVLAAAVALVVGCSSDFAPKNQVTGIRILAARADVPYARPGESVRVQTLAHDGRAAPASPMRVFWFPAPCVDPIAGQYFGCFPLFEALYPAGVDLTPSLVEGDELSITVPDDALANAVARPGQGERYATAFVFMVACAGHVERVARRGNLGPNALPVACFDESGRQLGPDDFVFGFTRVFVFDERRNAIPELGGVTFDGKPVDPENGVVTGTCVKDASGECKTVKLDVTFDDSAAEVDPDNVDSAGNVGRETIYVDWFTSIGKFQTNRKILFDGNLGRTPKAAIDFSPPASPGRGTVWAVLHDNRGGTSWVSFPLSVE